MKKKRMLVLVLITLTVFWLGCLTICAKETAVEEDCIKMFEKDLITGKEVVESVAVSDDESILTAEGYQTERPAPNIIIGDDERVAVPSMLLSEMPYSAIGRVRVTYFDGSSATGTGFLFGPNDVATAAHVLYNDEGSIAREVAFWLPGVGGPVATYTGTQLAIPEEFLDNHNSDYDWGMFHINSNIGNSVGYLGWTDNITINTTVQVIGYSSGQMLMAGKQVKIITGTSILYDVDADNGQSGSPVINRTIDNRIVAIHVGGGDVYDDPLNKGSRITSRMASVLNRYRNE